MKKFFRMSILLLLSLQLNSNELKWVDEQVEAIKPPREGISESEVLSLKDPFIFLKKTDVKNNATPSPTSAVALKEVAKVATEQVAPIKKKLKIDAIINKSVLIDGKWYKVSDKMGVYTIITINASSVTLSKNGKKEILSTNNENLKFKNKRD